MKKEKILKVYVILLFIASIIMNHNWRFSLLASLGLGIMFGISYVDYRKIQEKTMYIILAIYVGNIILRKGGVYGDGGVIVFTLTILCAWFGSRERKQQPSVGKMFVMGTLIGINIGATISWIGERLESIIAFKTREGKVNYIYETIDKIFADSHMIGRGVEEAELIRILPCYTSASVLVTYIANYGWLVGLLVAAAVAGIFGKILYDLQKAKGWEKRIGIGCVVILALEFFVTLLQNLLLMPFTLFGTKNKWLK